MRVAAIIQARMASTRLPGKVLRILAGKPILWHLLYRLKKSHTINRISIATTYQSIDDAIVEFANKENIPVIRGSAENVLERFCKAAEKLEADVVVRVTGDAPLVDPRMVDELVEQMLAVDADYAVGDPSMPCIHAGFDPIKVGTLFRLSREAGSDPVAREHVTAYIKKNPNFARVKYVPIPKEHQFDGARISIDAPADLLFLETIYKRLNAMPGEIDIAQVVALLKSEPSLLEINSRVRQKSVEQGNYKAIIRCDGDNSLGIGHVIRSLALADELREKQGIGVVFAMTQGPVSFSLVEKSGFPSEIIHPQIDEETWMDGLIEKHSPNILIFDLRNQLSSKAIHRWRNNGLMTVALDDASERRLACDAVFYPPVPQVEIMNWQGFSGQRMVGWEWVILRRCFYMPHEYTISQLPRILIAMGGSDSAALTLRAAKIIDEIEKTNFIPVILLGPAFLHEKELSDFLANTKHKFEIVRPGLDVVECMANCELAFISFGITAYELAALGVPAIHWCLTDDHAQSAQKMANDKMSINLGVHSNVNNETVRDSIIDLINNVKARNEMSIQSRKMVDGHGAERVAAWIADWVGNNSKNKENS